MFQLTAARMKYHVPVGSRVYSIHNSFLAICASPVEIQGPETRSKASVSE